MIRNSIGQRLYFLVNGITPSLLFVPMPICRSVAGDDFWNIGCDIFLHSEEDQGKTEDPTETKKRKAREEGQVFLTQELPQSVSFLVAVAIVFMLGRYYFGESARYLQGYLENPFNVELNAESLTFILRDNFVMFVKLILPVGVFVIMVSALLTLVQTKFLISFKNLKFNFKKIAPSWKNMMEKTIFSRTQLLNSIKIVVKVLVTGLISGFFIYTLVPELWGLVKTDVFTSTKKMSFWILELSMYLGGFMLLVAFPDWFIQRAEFLRKLKMTKDEIKQELKELEGDPLIKQKQRERAKEIASGNQVQRVPEADVLITNPTHFACAISYVPEYMDAPKVIAKGSDFIALKMREVATENDIPIVENRPLARAVYDQVEVDDYIPPEFYMALSEILQVLDKFKQPVN